MSSATGADLLLIDTDVLIDYLRDQPGAVAFLEAHEGPMAVSVITVAELHAGVRDGEERQRLSDFLEAFELIALERSAAAQAGLWRRDFGRSHGTGLADALIAATAFGLGATLVTLNRRHFPMIERLLVPYTKP